MLATINSIAGNVVVCLRARIKWLKISEGFSSRGMLIFTISFRRLVEASSEETSLKEIKLEMQNLRSFICTCSFPLPLAWKTSQNCYWGHYPSAGNCCYNLKGLFMECLGLRGTFSWVPALFCHLENYFTFFFFFQVNDNIYWCNMYRLKAFGFITLGLLRFYLVLNVSVSALAHKFLMEALLTLLGTKQDVIMLVAGWTVIPVRIWI